MREVGRLGKPFTGLVAGWHTSLSETRRSETVEEFNELQKFMIEVLYDEQYTQEWSDLYWGWFNYLALTRKMAELKQA